MHNNLHYKYMLKEDAQSNINPVAGWSCPPYRPTALWKFLPTASMFTICVITLFKLGVVYFSVPFTYWKSKIPRNTAHRHQSSAMRQAKQMNTAKTSSAEHTFDQQHH